MASIAWDKRLAEPLNNNALLEPNKKNMPGPVQPVYEFGTLCLRSILKCIMAVLAW
jgi:hypothetical protein